MYCATRRTFLKLFISTLLFINGFFAFGQPPVELPDASILPGQIDPKTLSQPQLRALLEDKNQEAGKDKNAELFKNSKIDKDSVVADAIRSNAYSPKKT